MIDDEILHVYSLYTLNDYYLIIFPLATLLEIFKKKSDLKKNHTASLHVGHLIFPLKKLKTQNVLGNPCY